MNEKNGKNNVPPVKEKSAGEMSAKNKKDKKILAVTVVCMVIALIAVSAVIIAVVKNKNGTDAQTTLRVSELTRQVVPASSESLPQSSDETASAFVSDVQAAQLPETAAPKNTQTATAAQTEAVANATPETTAALQTTEFVTIEGLEPLTKTGDNMISDSKDNEFIKIVSEKYSVDPSLLVAIYAVPDKGNNFVLEFNGTKDADGNLVRSPATLYRVHLVDLNRKVSTATGKITGNKGVSYPEGLLTFEMMKNVVMPQHPDYFTGIEQK